MRRNILSAVMVFLFTAALFGAAHAGPGEPKIIQEWTYTNGERYVSLAIAKPLLESTPESETMKEVFRQKISAELEARGFKQVSTVDRSKPFYGMMLNLWEAHESFFPSNTNGLGNFIHVVRVLPNNKCVTSEVRTGLRDYPKDVMAEMDNLDAQVKLQKMLSGITK